MVSERPARRLPWAVLPAAMVVSAVLLPVPLPPQVSSIVSASAREAPARVRTPIGDDSRDVRALSLLVENAAPDLNRIIDETQEELTSRPSDAELRFRLAFALEQRGDTDRAMQEYLTVIELAPGHVWARNNLGVL